MHTGDAVFEPPDMQMAFAEIDLIPVQIDGLSDPQAMPGHDEDQRSIALAMAAFAGCLNQPVKLSLGQIAPPIARLHGSITHWSVTAATAFSRDILTACRTPSSAPRISISITTLSGNSVESTLISTSGVRSAISPSMVILSAFHRLAVRLRMQ